MRSGHISSRHLLFAGLLVSSSCACDGNPALPPSEVTSAQFGLFFGGQVQQRLELPKPLSHSQSGQGVRLEFRRRLSQPTQVTWHLNHPTARNGPRGPCNAPRATRSASFMVPAGSDRFEQALAFEPTDPPGTYSLRVLVGDELVLDRSFRLVQSRLEDGE
jgi:hypothetical protein